MSLREAVLNVLRNIASDYVIPQEFAEFLSVEGRYTPNGGRETNARQVRFGPNNGSRNWLLFWECPSNEAVHLHNYPGLRFDIEHPFQIPHLANGREDLRYYLNTNIGYGPEIDSLREGMMQYGESARRVILNEELQQAWIYRRTEQSNAQSENVNGGNLNSNRSEELRDMKEEIKQLVESNLQVILTGAPGTGKTYTARKVALKITDEAEDTPEEESRIKVVQFHSGYDYSDFVIGMKPILVSENGKEVFKDEQGRLYTTNNNEADGQRQDFLGKVCVSYVWRDGVFKEFANRAKEAYDTSPDDPQKFVFLIDEINRADLSRVFGELFSLLEEDYRYPTKKKGIILPNGEEFVIPKNLYIIGTMNDIDRSVESMDFALRRRFAWYEVSADKSERIIEDKIDDAETKRKLLSAMRKVNEMIADPNSRLGKEYQLGGAIFAKYLKYQGEDDSFDSLWNNHIAVILNEYLRGRRDKESKLVELKNAYDEGIQSQNGVGGSDVTSQD